MNVPIPPALWHHGLPRSFSAVSGGADGGQTDSPHVRRFFCCLAYLPGVLSGHFAARIFICPLAYTRRRAEIETAVLPHLACWSYCPAGYATSQSWRIS